MLCLKYSVRTKDSRYKADDVTPVVTRENLLSKTLQERAKRNKWTQAKIEFEVDNHNGQELDKLKTKKELECERCMRPVTPRNVQRLPDGSLMHYYNCA